MMNKSYKKKFKFISSEICNIFIFNVSDVILVGKKKLKKKVDKFT